MTWIRHSGIAVVLLAVASLATGCCDKEKKQIEYLTQQNTELGDSNKDLRGQLASAKNRESDLLSQIETKDLTVSALRAENTDLRQKLSAAGTAAAPVRPGETPVYKVTVGSDILFPAGRATLSSAGKTRLNEILRELKARYAGMMVRVYGYTDSDPIKHSRKLWQDNLDLSANRAMAVTRYLISKGIDADNVETIAMGATHFIASNNTKAGKAKNRRVVLVVVK
jgi:outer membrane protein OmpA-like peptidoglycan-associated protein